MMKHYFNGKIPGVVSIALLVLAAFLFAQTIKTFAEYPYIGAGIQPTNTISVSGEGEVFAVPDIAQFTFSIEEDGETPEEAQAKATERVNTALAFVREAGVEEKDIKTSYFNLTPRYESVRRVCPPQEPCPTDQKLVGFRVNQTIEIKVRDTTKAGTFVAGLANVGVQNVNGPNFTIDDDEVLRSEARTLAINDAKKKAKVLAGQLDVALVRIVQFSEDGGNYPPMPYARQSMDMMESAGGAPKAPDMPVGENQIRTQVTITYEVR